MTLFEYVSIATSLILSFSLARTFSNLAPIFASGRRYWVHSIWVLGLLVYHVSLFWQLWLYQGVEDWTLFKFVLLLLGPIVLLIGVSLLVPVETVSDYRSYFESIRKQFYSVLIVIQLQPIALPFLLFDVPFALHPLVLGGLISALAAGVGLVAQRSLVDAILVCFFTIGVVGGLFTINDHEAMMESMQLLLQ